MFDVYFEKEYARLYEHCEHGTAEEFVYSNAFGEVRHIFIKRPIDIQIDGTQYYDIVSPYGYAGPYISKIFAAEHMSVTDFADLLGSEYEQGAKALIAEFSDAFNDYCMDNNIVAEFLRFHPLVNNAKFAMEAYDPKYDRHTIAVDISRDDFMSTQFTSKCRNTVRKAYKLGVQIEVDEKCERLDEFIDLYELTMKKNHATGYYFFKREYYTGLVDTLKDGIIMIHATLDNKIISSAMFMMSDHFMHYHLSSTHPDYYKYAANNAILEKACEYGNKRGLALLHLGGGLDGDEHNSLYSFKKQFGKNDYNIRDFYIGRRVHDEKIYDALVEKAAKDHELNSDFFPMYRS